LNPINTDRIYNASSRLVGQQAFRFISKFDSNLREAGALGLALCLLRVCEHWRVDVREFLKVAEQVFRKAEESKANRSDQTEIRAVDQYIQEEL